MFQIKKFEVEIDDVKANDAADFERLLRKFRYFLHENHYWVLDVKRRLIDIYGNKEGFEIYKLPKVRTITAITCMSDNDRVSEAHVAALIRCPARCGTLFAM